MVFPLSMSVGMRPHACAAGGLAKAASRVAEMRDSSRWPWCPPNGLAGHEADRRRRAGRGLCASERWPRIAGRATGRYVRQRTEARARCAYAVRVPGTTLQSFRPVRARARAVRANRCDAAEQSPRINYRSKEKAMSLGTILLIVLVLMLIGVLPTWGHSRSWGYGPSGGLGLILIIVIVLLVMGRL
jgi:Protein of unknown function (DUF3309)